MLASITLQRSSYAVMPNNLLVDKQPTTCSSVGLQRCIDTTAGISVTYRLINKPDIVVRAEEKDRTSVHCCVQPMVASTAFGAGYQVAISQSNDLN
jgi:hypothetical protein